MSLVTNIKRAECAQRAAAEEALQGLSDKDKANFALSLLMKITDPDAAAVVRFAGNQLAELSNILMREAFERECG
jgi:hypothetical protein